MTCVVYTALDVLSRHSSRYSPMSDMTVHTNRPRCPENACQTNHGPLLINGDKTIEGPILRQSWNGCIWQIKKTSAITNLPPNANNMLNRNHQSGLLHNTPFTRNSMGSSNNDRDSILSKSRESFVAQGSDDQPNSADTVSNYSPSNDVQCNDRLSNDRFMSERLRNVRLNTTDRLAYIQDNCTTASLSVDSAGHGKVHEAPDRDYKFKSRSISHHSSLIDLKRNSLYLPKINNDELAANNNFNSAPYCKPKTTLRSVSVNETNLDAVNPDGSRIPWAKKGLRRIYENIGEVLKPKLESTKSSLSENMVIHNEYIGNKTGEVSVTASVTSGKTSDLGICNLNDSGIVQKRSQSLSELHMFSEQNENEPDLSSSSNSGCDNSDIDGDDFGFLSHSYVHSTPAMQKTKSTLASHHILPKRWRSKPRNATASQCTWSPEGNCTWSNVNGKKIILKPISILQLSEAERLTLQKIVLQKIQSFDLGCNVTVPKEHRTSGKRKHLLTIKRSKSANFSGLIHSIADKEKDKDQHLTGCVFGRPLKKCVADDMEMERRRNGCTGTFEERKTSDVILVRQSNKQSSSSSQGSLENCTPNGSASMDSRNRNASCDSLSEQSESSRNTSSSQVDGESLSDNRSDSLTQSSVSLYATGPPQVPRIVKVCFQHIETYGLRVLGIFRVGSSKKRTKMLRDEFDSGRDVQLNESYNPHEVGAVLKEYFRDLPEPLLTRDLYSPLIAARGLPDIEKQNEVTRMLISLLPVANRDTLWALLQFLSKLKEHSTDAVDGNGQTVYNSGFRKRFLLRTITNTGGEEPITDADEISVQSTVLSGLEDLPGNKMDSHNLATLFGPNILHKTKINDKGITVESAERAGERKTVIDVVKALIDFHQMYFQLPAAVHDAVLQTLLESDPTTTEGILQRITSENGSEADPDTSVSLYDGSETSVTNSMGSENSLLMTNINSLALHPTLKSAKSAETLTLTSRRKCFFFLENERGKEINRHKSDVNNIMERPKFQLVIENSPSPPEVRENPERIKCTSVTRDSSSPELLRPHSIHVERPHSELNCKLNTLAIPQAECVGHSSDSNQSNKTYSRTNSLGHIGCDSSRVGSSRNMTSSVMRPLNFNRSNVEGENEWQKYRWRQWGNVTARKPNDGFEQETLV